ncbi:MAG: glucosamine-6-phosphate deaminase [Planctomycetes bacterium]|nr:glucosamine-6-phosphate deaminase [Planctomycetota bacterium]
MERYVFADKEAMGAAAAAAAAEEIKAAIADKGRANIILATGASQFEVLKNLVAAEGIDWSKVVMFHLDEYIGIGRQHPASFRKYLKERFADQVSGLKATYFVDGDAEDPQAECNRLGEIIAAHPIDAAMVGIGENGHLAFNDPPADFETEAAYIVVDLDAKCRRQQLGEGWFRALDDVPAQAISMSIRQIMKSRCIICSVPDERKAEAVKAAVQRQVSNMCPSSILQAPDNCTLYLDEAAASLLAK